MQLPTGCTLFPIFKFYSVFQICIRVTDDSLPKVFEAVFDVMLGHVRMCTIVGIVETVPKSVLRNQSINSDVSETCKGKLTRQCS